MPKIHKIETIETKKQVLVVKATFLSLVLLLTFFMHIYLKNRPLSPPPLKESKKVAESSPSVLGVNSQEELVSSLEKELGVIKGKLDILLNDAQSVGQNVFNDTTEELQDSIFDIAYDKAVEPVITQIQNLPSEQQDQIRQAICK